MRECCSFRSPRATRIDPTQFMLSAADRKMSAPVFSSLHQPEDVEEQHIQRSAEMDNIPEQVQSAREEQLRRIRYDGLPGWGWGAARGSYVRKRRDG